MKKVKFTLGLTLVMLLTGVNFVSAELVERDPALANREGNNRFEHTISVDLGIAPSPYYMNGGEAMAGNLYCNYQLISVGDPMDFGSDLRTDPFELTDSYGSWALTAYPDLNYTNLDRMVVLRDTVQVYHYGTVRLAYLNGIDYKPFVKRIVTCGKWMYDTDNKYHVMVPTHVEEDQILPYSTTFKQHFTFGTEIAEFHYRSDIMQLLNKTPLIYSIRYEIGVHDYFGGDDDGQAYGNKFHNRSVIINAAPGISVNPKPDAVIPVKIVSGKSYTFDVSGDASKELEVTSSDKLWNVNNGGIKIVPDGPGKWKVTLYKVGASMIINVGYKTTTESGEGEDGQTGNGIFAANAVWGAGGILYVKAAAPGTLSVYSVAGQLCKQVFVSGDYNLNLPKGLYIVQLNGKAVKVVL